MEVVVDLNFAPLSLPLLIRHSPFLFPFFLPEEKKTFSRFPLLLLFRPFFIRGKWKEGERGRGQSKIGGVSGQ